MKEPDLWLAVMLFLGICIGIPIGRATKSDRMRDKLGRYVKKRPWE